MTSVELRRGDYSLEDTSTWITLNVTFIEQRDTREPFSKPVPMTKLRIIFDYGNFTRYFILTCEVIGETKDEAYEKINAIETAVEDWWNVLTYGALPTLRIKWAPSYVGTYTGGVTKFNKRLDPKVPTAYEFTIEFLQGQETQPS